MLLYYFLVLIWSGTGLDPSPVPRIKSRHLLQQMSVESNLGRDGVAIINDFMDRGPIANLQKTISQIPIRFFTNSTNMTIEDSPLTFLPWRPLCSVIMEEFEKVNDKNNQSDTANRAAVEKISNLRFRLPDY